MRMGDDLGPSKGIANGVVLTLIVAATIFGAWYLAKIMLGVEQMKGSVKCKESEKGQFTAGKSYPIDDAYDKSVVVNDDKGNFHHLKTDGEFFAEHFEPVGGK